MEQRKKVFRVVNQSVLSAEEGSGDEGLKLEQEPGVPTSVCKPDRNEITPCKTGLMTASDSVESVLSEGNEFYGIAGNLSAGSNPSPDSSSPHSLFPTTKPLVYFPTRSISEEEGESRSHFANHGFQNSLRKVVILGQQVASPETTLIKGDVVLMIGPGLLWRTDWRSAGYQSSAEAARVSESPPYTILGCLGHVLELVEL